MAGRTQAEAVQNFIDPIRKALSCVTNMVAQVSGYHASQNPLGLTINGGSPLPLKCEHKTRIAIRQQFAVVSGEGERGPWKVSTENYIYEIEDEERNRLVAYHWHPGTGKDAPHLHVGMGVGLEARPDFMHAHLPTGRVSIEEVLRWVIEECGVEPNRTDWKSVLDETQGRFEKWRLWSHGVPPESR
jgi:hypothetical protein